MMIVEFSDSATCRFRRTVTLLLPLLAAALLSVGCEETAETASGGNAAQAQIAELEAKLEEERRLSAQWEAVVEKQANKNHEARVKAERELEAVRGELAAVREQTASTQAEPIVDGASDSDVPPGLSALRSENEQLRAQLTQMVEGFERLEKGLSLLEAEREGLRKLAGKERADRLKIEAELTQQIKTLEKEKRDADSQIQELTALTRSLRDEADTNEALGRRFAKKANEAEEYAKDLELQLVRLRSQVPSTTPPPSAAALAANTPRPRATLPVEEEAPAPALANAMPADVPPDATVEEIDKAIRERTIAIAMAKLEAKRRELERLRNNRPPADSPPINKERLDW